MRVETERKRGVEGGAAQVSLPTALRQSLSFHHWPDFHCHCTHNIPATFITLFSPVIILFLCPSISVVQFFLQLNVGICST